MKQREQVGFLPSERIASNETFIFYSFNVKYLQFSLPYTLQLTCDLTIGTRVSMELSGHFTGTNSLCFTLALLGEYFEGLKDIKIHLRDYTVKQIKI